MTEMREKLVQGMTGGGAAQGEGTRSPGGDTSEVLIR